MILVLYATHGFHIRNLFDSGLVAELSRSFKIVVFTNPADTEYMRRDYGDLVEVRGIATASRLFETKLEFVRKRIVVKPDRAVTTSVFSEQERHERPFRQFFLHAINRVLGRSRTVRSAWLQLERWLVPGTEFDQELRRLHPAVVVTANYGTDSGTIRLLRATRRLHIPAVAVVPSFDNLTSKGVMGARPGKLVVWNEAMRGEALQLHDFVPERVAVCGAVQFDVYAQSQRWPAAESVWRELGLDPARPTIVFGTITPAYFPHNIEVVELLIEAVLAGDLPETCQLLVRLHPQVVDGGTFGDDLVPYRRLADRHSFVALDVPAVRRWSTMQPPAKDDMPRLAAILFHAAAIVVPASTLALDAAALDTPIVGVAFDGRTERHAAYSVERMFYFTHYRPITDSGAITLARSPKEMVEALREALNHRETYAAARLRLATDTLGPRDGGALGRVASVIRREAGIET